MSNQLTGSSGPMLVRTTIPASGPPLGQIVFPATVNVADPAGLTDTNEAQLSVDATGRLRAVITAAAGTIFNVQPSVLADSVGITNRAVAPGAGAVIATITPAAGTWDVEVFAAFDVGAPVAAVETNNMQFRKAGAAISVLQVLPVINIYGPARKFRVVLNGAQTIDVQAIAAASAGVGYSAEITCTRIA